MATLNFLRYRIAVPAMFLLFIAPKCHAQEFEVDANTVALYHLDEGSGIILFDASGNNKHGILRAGTWTDEGKFGKAIFLDGVDDYFEIPSPNQLALQNGWTIELWVKPLEYRNEPCCLNATYVFSASREQYEFHLFQPGGKDATRFIPAPGIFIDGGPVRMGEWNYVLASVDAQGNARFYINGILQAEGTVPSIPNDDTPLNFGRRASGYFGTFHLHGFIDEIRVSNVARGPFGKEFTPDEHTVALYHFNEGIVNSVSDTSGNNNRGAILGGTKWTMQGRFGTALDFDGVDSYVRIPDSPSFDTISSNRQLTIELWLYLRSYPSPPADHLVTKWSGTGHNNQSEFYIDVRDDGRVSFFLNSGPPTESVVSSVISTAQIPLSSWHSLRFLWDGIHGKALIYMDRQEIGSSDAMVGSVPNSGTDVYISGPSPYSLDGVVDEVRISNIARYEDGIRLLDYQEIDHLKEAMEAGDQRSFLQRLFDAVVRLSLTGPEKYTTDATIGLFLSHASEIESVTGHMSSPDNPAFDERITFDRNADGSYQQRVAIEIKNSLDISSFLSLLGSIAGKGTAILPSPVIGYAAPLVILDRIDVVLRNGTFQSIPTHIELPRYDRAVFEHLDFLNTVQGINGYTRVMVACPVDVMVRDSEGRRLGVMAGEQFSEIPYAVCTGDTEPEALIIFGDEEYDLIIHGTGTGYFNVDFCQNTIFSGSGGKYISYEDVPVTISTACSMRVGAYVKDYRMYIDADGDGSYESQALPSAIVSVEDQVRDNSQPTLWNLSCNYPNPFNRSTRISYSIPKSSNVKLQIFGLLGKPVRILVEREQAPGIYSVCWDGKDSEGRAVPSGVYVYRLQAGPFVQSRRMVLLR